MRKQGVSWGAHDDSAPPQKPWTWYVKKAVVLSIILGLFIVGVFVVIPHVRNSHYRDELAAANALAEKGPIEGAIEKYQALEAEAKGSEFAESAASERAKLEPAAAAALDLKRQADEAYRKQDYEGALKLYRETAEKYPLSDRGAEALKEVPLCLKAMCDAIARGIAPATAEKRWSTVKALYEKILSVDPNNADAKAGLQAAAAKTAEAQRLVAAAQAAENSGDVAKAVALYGQALAVEPDAPGVSEARIHALARVPPPAGMTLIMPGEFTVGEEGVSSSVPVRKLQSPGFYLDITEVTNAQYAKFVTATSHPPPPSWRGNEPPEDALELPVVCVSWDDAAAYAAWAGKRLPTGNEWERAARGPNGHAYPWGNAFQRSAGAFSRAPAPVGRMKDDKSAEGCMDMAGNVAQWVADDVATPPQYPPPRQGEAPRPATSFKAVCGASWAGLERDRLERVVPVNYALPSTDPVKTVWVDKPGVRGLKIGATAEVEFFFAGMADDQPLISMRKWIPELRKVVVGSFQVKPGAKIEGEKNVLNGSGSQAPSVHVRLDSGCILVSAGDARADAKAKMTYKDADGREYTATYAGRGQNDSPQAPELNPETNEGRQFQGFLGEMSARPLADEARSAHRSCAPRDGRYLNCGFRCAKDFQ